MARRSLREWLADPAHRAGYESDPAEVQTPTAWLRVGLREFYAWPWRIQVIGPDVGEPQECQCQENRLYGTCGH